MIMLNKKLKEHNLQIENHGKNIIKLMIIVF